MFDKKNVKEVKETLKEILKDMFKSGELSVEVVKTIGEYENDYLNVAVKIDNEIVCQKGEYIRSIPKPKNRDPKLTHSRYNI